MSPDAIKLKLTIAFDGTNYAGWQVQDSGTGIQELVEKGIAELFQGEHRLHSSSRTDAGVHARGMVAHVEIPRERFRIPVRKVCLALNARLPEDIRVVEARKVPASFHARFLASGKEYRYAVWNHFAMDPLLRHQAWHVPQPLDLARMRAAARVIVGRHDFRSFAATHNYFIADTVRRLHRVDIRRSGSLLSFRIEGDGFLYKMCRGIVGTLVQVGRGRFSPEEVRGMLAAKDRRAAGMSAPACGLVLWRVMYRRGTSRQAAPAGTGEGDE
ncbi:MAG TPA: tRNA pseudouridine(38-40) synthase TruA [Verrucomicrobiales bacterium]|nr:tRNA pseudouridine(38-40) synthase TruA [Verrucomicrobiales bacterium]